MKRITDQARVIATIRQAVSELAQPVAVVSGTLGSLLLELRQESEYGEALQAINDQVERITQLVEQIWQLADQAKLQAQGKEINLNARIDKLSPFPNESLDLLKEPRPARDLMKLTRGWANIVNQIRKAFHDLAQPLLVVSATIDLLLLEFDQESQYFHEVQIISEQMEQIVHTIDVLRRMARQLSDALQEQQI